MEIIKTGLAAFGMSGQVFHAPFISTNPHFELYKIVERSKELSKERYPQASIVRSFKELTEDPEIDLIVVNTPDNTHYEYAGMALEAGKNVVVEKPFTSTTKQGEEYESTFARYRNFIKPNTWKETGESGGGLTYNLGSHLIDQAIQLFGMPEAVFADLGILREGGKVDDYFIIHLLHPSLAPNVKITLKASYLMREAEPRFALHGTLGSYVKYGVDKQEAALLAGEIPERPNWGEESEQEWGLLHTEINGKEICRKYPGIAGNYGGFYQNIYEHLCLGQPLETHAQDILNVIRIIEAAYQSHRENKIVNLK